MTVITAYAQYGVRVVCSIITSRMALCTGAVKQCPCKLVRAYRHISRVDDSHTGRMMSCAPISILIRMTSLTASGINSTPVGLRGLVRIASVITD